MSREPSTHQQGQRGEERAIAYLCARGYSVIERNFRCRLGEIDIVAREGDALAFVEVRTRSDGRRGTALETITLAKQRRIARVAGYYLSVRNLHFALCRFDVLGITGEQVELIRDAFRIGL